MDFVLCRPLGPYRGKSNHRALPHRHLCLKSENNILTKKWGESSNTYLTHARRLSGCTESLEKIGKNIGAFSRSAFKILPGKPTGKTSLGKFRSIWKGNIRIDLKEIGFNMRNCICLAQDIHCQIRILQTTGRCWHNRIT